MDWPQWAHHGRPVDALWTLCGPLIEIDCRPSGRAARKRRKSGPLGQDLSGELRAELSGGKAAAQPPAARPFPQMHTSTSLEGPTVARRAGQLATCAPPPSSATHSKRRAHNGQMGRRKRAESKAHCRFRAHLSESGANWNLKAARGWSLATWARARWGASGGLCVVQTALHTLLCALCTEQCALCIGQPERST